MSDNSTIAWTDATWNVSYGCSPAGAGCKSCYAQRMMSRSLPNLPHGLTRDGRWTGEVRFAPDNLAIPLHWRQPRRIFVNSMSDLFHESLSNEQIAAVFGVMAKAFWHTFIVPTKRSRRRREWFEWLWSGRNYQLLLQSAQQYEWPVHAMRAVNRGEPPEPRFGQPLLNVWQLASASTQAEADSQWADLAQTPAAVRGLSLEPLVEAIDLEQLNDGSWYDREGAQLYDALRGHAYYRDGEHGLGGGPHLDWVIVGGESGPRARPCNVEWIRSIARQCAEAGVACFAKQIGARAQEEAMGEWGVGTFDLRLRDRAGADPSEWPEDIRVRQWPEVRR